MKLNIYNFLKIKGYNGKENLNELLNWLDSKNIRVSVFACYNSDENDIFEGYQPSLSMGSQTIIYDELFYSIENAIEVILFKLYLFIN